MPFKAISGIYTITNLLNNKIYIGESKNVNQRLNQHKNQLKNNKHSNDHLQRAFNLDGEENFLFEMLEPFPFELLKARENFWCNLLNTHNDKYGYNIQPTGNDKKVPMAEETKLKLSKLLTGRKMPEDYCIKLKERMKGKDFPEEGQKRGREVRMENYLNTGNWFTEEGLKKIKESNKNREVSEETRKKIGLTSSRKFDERGHTEERIKEKKYNCGKAFRGKKRPDHSIKLKEKWENPEFKKAFSEKMKGKNKKKQNLKVYYNNIITSFEYIQDVIDFTKLCRYSVYKSINEGKEIKGFKIEKIAE